MKRTFLTGFARSLGALLALGSLSNGATVASAASAMETAFPLMTLKARTYYGPGHDSKLRAYKHGMKNKARFHKTGRSR